MASIGSNIRKYRKERYLTQEKLAELVGISVKTMSFYETGKRNVPSDCLISLAEALGVTTDELCGQKKSQDPSDQLAARINRAILCILEDFDITAK